MATLSIAIVTYRPDIELLARCLESLHTASEFARRKECLSGISLVLLDNSTNPQICDRLSELLYTTTNPPWETAQVLATPGNLGYGRAHNLAITNTHAKYHLVLNPDVLLEEDAIHNALQFMEQHLSIALLTPAAVNEHGKKEYLNKRHPGFLTLMIRGFAPALLKNRLQDKISYYEMLDLNPDTVHYDIPLASGCFMFFRTSTLKKLGGFSDKFFLYFEDYDLSIRTHGYGRIAYVPSVKITHFGGGAARKGLTHILLFTRSAITFFNLHGWKLW